MKLYIVTGQTATGKTQLALELAQKHNGELINCDSRQIYKHLDIITGKDINKNSKFEIRNLKYSFDIGYYFLKSKISDRRSKIWLYDVVDPKQYFSSFDYQQCAIYVIKKLSNEKKTPIIVGGTYFYLFHLLYKISTENIPPNWRLRQQLNKKSVSELQKKLIQLNVQSFNRLNHSDKNNPQRLIRKIEILSEKKILPIDQFQPRRLEFGDKINIPDIKILFIGLKHKKKEDLTKVIKKRVELRLKKGAVDEVKKLINQGYLENDCGLKTIGYQQIMRYVKGKISKKQAVEEWINKEVQYAKRQYTFMKKDSNIIWKEI